MNGHPRVAVFVPDRSPDQRSVDSGPEVRPPWSGSRQPERGPPVRCRPTSGRTTSRRVQSRMALMSPPRPSPELLERLREDKRRLHAAARALPPNEKVRRVIELQRIDLHLITQQLPPRPHI